MSQVEIADQASAMKAVKPLPDSIPLARRVVTADALPMQVETARYLVEDKPAHCLIGSPTRAQANAEQLLALDRGHGGIENKLQCVRDVAYDEDRCRARKDNTPRALPCMRDFAISLLRLPRVRNSMAALRDLAASARKILTILRL